MSATYRIEIEHDAATDTRYKWNWYLWRISDCTIAASGYAETTGEAENAALDTIKRLRDEQRGVTLYADEDGNLTTAPEPQSLRA